VFAVHSGRADGTIVLADDRTTIDGMVDARGITSGAVTLARLTANAKLVNGSGDVHAAFAGRRGAAFAFSTQAHISPDRIGLSRAGLVLASKPIDAAVAAIVTGNHAAIRAVAASDGAIVGRMQARFAPLGSGPLVAELMNAPLFAQLRYGGPADTLWRLTGSEVIDMSGPLALGADITGKIGRASCRERG